MTLAGLHHDHTIFRAEQGQYYGAANRIRNIMRSIFQHAP